MTDVPELRDALLTFIGIVDLAILVALLRWVRGNGSAPPQYPESDIIDAVARYLNSASRTSRGDDDAPTPRV